MTALFRPNELVPGSGTAVQGPGGTAASPRQAGRRWGCVT